MTGTGRSRAGRIRICDGGMPPLISNRISGNESVATRKLGDRREAGMEGLSIGKDSANLRDVYGPMASLGMT